MNLLDTCDKTEQAIQRAVMLRHIGEGILKQHKKLGNSLCLLAVELENDLEAVAAALEEMRKARS